MACYLPSRAPYSDRAQYDLTSMPGNMFLRPLNVARNERHVADTRQNTQRSEAPFLKACELCQSVVFEAPGWPSMS